MVCREVACIDKSRNGEHHRHPGASRMPSNAERLEPILPQPSNTDKTRAQRRISGRLPGPTRVQAALPRFRNAPTEASPYSAQAVKDHGRALRRPGVCPAPLIRRHVIPASQYRLSGPEVACPPSPLSPRDLDPDQAVFLCLAHSPRGNWWNQPPAPLVAGGACPKWKLSRILALSQASQALACLARGRCSDDSFAVAVTLVLRRPFSMLGRWPPKPFRFSFQYSLRTPPPRSCNLTAVLEATRAQQCGSGPQSRVLGLQCRRSGRSREHRRIRRRS